MSEPLDELTTATLEAFADTIIPGQRRFPGDRSVAGATSEPGAVAAGALELLNGPEGGLAHLLAPLAASVNEHARRYADQRGIALGDSVPPLVALSFADRTRLVAELTSPEHPERELWNGIAIFSYMAFDSAAHLSTADALATNHVGLSMMGFADPDPDGLWRFPDHSYGRPLARLHPQTGPHGSLA